MNTQTTAPFSMAFGYSVGHTGCLVPSLACYAVVSTGVEWDIEMPMFELGRRRKATGVIDDVRLAHRTATAAGRARYKCASRRWRPFSESSSKPSDSGASCSAVWRKCRWNGSS